MSRPIDRTLRRIPNLLPVLMVLTCLGVLPSSHHSLEAVRVFSMLVVPPVLLPLCGFLSQKLSMIPRRITRQTAGLLVLYAAMSVLVFWTKAAGHGEAFQLFTHIGPAWLFLVLAECFVCMSVLEWLSVQFGWKKRVIFVVISALSVFSGYLPLYRDILCSGRLTLCLPLFLVGRWMDPYTLAVLLKRNKRLKWLGILCPLVLFGLSWGMTDRLVELSDQLLGISGYLRSELWWYICAAGLIRAVQIAGGAFLTLFLLALAPERKLPLWSVLGRRFYIVWFFHAPAAYLLAAWVNNGGAAVGILRMVLVVVLPFVAAVVCQYPLRRLAMSVTALFLDNEEEPSRPGKPSPAFWFYCLAFSVLLTAYASVLVAKGKTFIWKPDGEDLYVTIMYYTRDYILGVLKTLFTTGRFVLPQYDFSIGQGAGILSVLHLNPFFLPAMLLPRAMLEQVYGAYALGQLFLAGLCFAYFARLLGVKRELPLWLGALTYAFSGFCLFSAGKHVYFITYMVLGLPLLLAGCERWLQKRKWGLFVVTVVLLFLGGYYYTWMDSLLMAIYLVVRELHRHRFNLKKVLAECFQLLGLYLWGFGLSMVFFLPAMSNLFGSSRTPTADGGGMQLLVNAAFAKKVFLAFFSVVPDGPNWTRLGFIGLTLFALVVLFLRLRERNWASLRALAVILTLCLFIPVMGSLFNGLGYSTNRWSYGIALLNAVIFSVVFPHLTSLRRWEQAAGVLVTLGCCVALLLMSRNQVTQLTVVMLVGSAASVVIACRFRDKWKGERLLALVTVFALMVNCGYYYRAYKGQNASAYLKKGKGAAKYTSSAEAAALDLEQSPYRIELPANRTNTFCLTGGNGTSTYWSVLDGTQVSYYLDFDLNTVRQVYALWGLDERAALCAAASVKYYVGDNEEQVPYGFTEYAQDEASGKTIYQNQLALPFGYTYDSYLSRSDYEELTPLQRQEALLQAAVVEDGDIVGVSDSLSPARLRLTETSHSWTLDSTDGVELVGDSFHVTKANASAVITFRGTKDSETYLSLKGLAYSGKESEATVSVTGGNVTKKGQLFRPGSLYAFQRSGTTWNLGYHEEPLTSLTLTFDVPGDYTAEELSVVCLSMSDYTRSVSQRSETVLENVRETLNGGIIGDIRTEKEQMLVFSVPWSKGWELTLNGQPAPLTQVNGMYMGVMLRPGSYRVELTYHAPGIIPGAAVTGISLVGLLGYGIFWLLRKQSEKAMRD